MLCLTNESIANDAAQFHTCCGGWDCCCCAAAAALATFSCTITHTSRQAFSSSLKLESTGRQDTIFLTMNRCTTGHGGVATRRSTVLRVLNAYASSAP